MNKLPIVGISKTMLPAALKELRAPTLNRAQCRAKARGKEVAVATRAPHYIRTAGKQRGRRR